MRKLIFILFVLLEFSLSSANCFYYSYTQNFAFDGQCGNKTTSNGSWCSGESLTFDYCCTNSLGTSNYTITLSGSSSTCSGHLASAEVLSSGCVSGNGWSSYINYRVFICSNKDEADSVKCVNKGGDWQWSNGECKENKCDTTMICITYPYNYCNDVQNDLDITCVNGNCWGIGGAKWVSYYDRNCSNECGTTETTRVSGDTVFVPGGSCDDPINCDPTTYCSDFENGTYFLYQVCLIGREVVGNVDERQTMTQITYSGVGTCKDNGYSSKTYPNSGGGNTSPHQSQPDSISTECAIYGVGCEPYQDTTQYSQGDNATPTKCWCEPFDGNNSVSQIICPDGSHRIVYFSCEDWQKMFSSSSSAPPSGGSSTSGGGSSGSISNSSDSNPFKGKYPEYPSDQPTTNKNVQGALSGISDYIISIRDHLAQLKNYILSDNSESYKFDSVSLTHRDYENLDSLGPDFPKISFDSLWNIIDTSAHIIDTSVYVGAGTCPVIEGKFSLCKKIPFFRGNTDIDMKFDLSNFYGFNLCSIIKALVIGFASVVSTLLSLRLFLKSGL